jgi:hypothetical protein
MEEQKLRASENRMLRRMSGPKKEEVAESWRPHNEQLHRLLLW